MIARSKTVRNQEFPISKVCAGGVQAESLRPFTAGFATASDNVTEISDLSGPWQGENTHGGRNTTHLVKFPRSKVRFRRDGFLWITAFKLPVSSVACRSNFGFHEPVAGNRPTYGLRDRPGHARQLRRNRGKRCLS